jgi:hypothetical protein
MTMGLSRQERRDDTETQGKVEERPAPGFCIKRSPPTDVLVFLSRGDFSSRSPRVASLVSSFSGPENADEAVWR